MSSIVMQIYLHHQFEIQWMNDANVLTSKLLSNRTVKNHKAAVNFFLTYLIQKMLVTTLTIVLEAI